MRTKELTTMNTLQAYRLHLREADDEEEEEKPEQLTQEEQEKRTETDPNSNSYVEAPMTPDNTPPIKDEAAIPVQDGAIPQDSQGIADGSYDPLDPIGNAEIKFAQGNFKTIAGLPQLVNDKTAQLMQTFVPLMEVGMIELLGNSQMYQRQLAQIQPSFDNQGKLSLEFTFQYVVQNWIGTDIDQESIKHDANYILEKIVPTKANVTKCEINCADGLLTIMGTL
jgi:hypothetical protein